MPRPTPDEVFDTTLMSRMVIMYAIGSFEPLSSSSSGRRFCLSPCFLLRRMEKTDAESVEDIVEASSSASANGISIPSHGATSHTKPASTNAVMTTPTVASTTPGPMMGFISENFVSIPPVKRIMHKAIIPTNWVISTERYEMKFKPNNMPTPEEQQQRGGPETIRDLAGHHRHEEQQCADQYYVFTTDVYHSSPFMLRYALSTMFSLVSGLYSRSAYSNACMAAKLLSGVR